MIFINSKFKNLKPEEVSNRKTVLAFTAPRKSGKSKCSQVIQEIDNRFKIKAFSDILKEKFCILNDIPKEIINSNLKKEEYRKAIVDLSWELKDKFGSFYFAEEFFNSLTEDSFHIIEDLRFLEELQLLCMFGGLAYKVEANLADRVARGYKYDPEVDEEMAETDVARLSGYTLYKCTGGGSIFNTKPGEAYLREQLSSIIKLHFTFIPDPKVYVDLEKSYSMEF